VDGHDYINVPSGLPADSPARSQGWFDYVAVVHPVDREAQEHMMSQGYGNPFLHHMTWGIVPPSKGSRDDLAYVSELIPYAVQCREKIGDAIGEKPGTLIFALPEGVVGSQEFKDNLPDCLAGLEEDECQIETMQGGGYLVQFFVLTGGRIEVALRVETHQTFNPKSVHKISKDEISAVQTE
jgi:hypothetical protein